MSSSFLSFLDHIKRRTESVGLLWTSYQLVPLQHYPVITDSAVIRLTVTSGTVFFVLISKHYLRIILFILI